MKAWLLCGAVAVSAWYGGVERFPRDPEGTLQAVRGAVLEVGAIEAPPWLVRTDDGASGPEARLIEAFAQSLGARVHWRWASESRLFEACRAFRVHLVAGGLTADNPWRRRVAFTEPWLTEALGVGWPVPNAEGDLRGVTVAIASDSGLGPVLRARGARPQCCDDPWTSGLPVAAARRDLVAHGLCVPRGPELGLRERVLAVPPGENELLLTLERFLRQRPRADSHESAAEVER